jgi:mono/diheme cytochrome c family protein
MLLLRRLFLFLAASGGAAGLVLAAGCTYAHGPDPGPCPDVAPATYAAVIAPIVSAHCLECHGHAVYQTLGGGNDYSTYQGFKNQSASYMLGCVRHTPGTDAMPKGRPKLSDCDIARLQAWVDAGQPNN